MHDSRVIDGDRLWRHRPAAQRSPRASAANATRQRTNYRRFSRPTRKDGTPPHGQIRLPSSKLHLAAQGLQRAGWQQPSPRPSGVCDGKSRQCCVSKAVRLRLGVTAPWAAAVPRVRSARARARAGCCKSLGGVARFGRISSLHWTNRWNASSPSSTAFNGTVLKSDLACAPLLQRLSSGDNERTIERRRRRFNGNKSSFCRRTSLVSG